MHAHDIRCPTCRVQPGAACVRLIRDPAGRVRWAGVEAHLARIESAATRG